MKSMKQQVEMDWVEPFHARTHKRSTARVSSCIVGTVKMRLARVYTISDSILEVMLP